MTTIKEIAEIAKVSIATVSRVINKSGFVSQDKIERVNAALEKLDYRPNFFAKSLRIGKTHSIGLCVPDNSNPFFAELAKCIEKISYQNGYNIILCDSDYSSSKEKEYINILTNQKVDGFVLVSSSYDNILFQNKIKTPFVVIDHNITDTFGRKIEIDYQSGGYLATTHLIDKGHKRIACIAGPANKNTTDQRLLGFMKALKENDLNIDDSLIEQGNFKVDGGISAMKRLLDNPNPPTAVFVLNDLMAIGAIHAIHDSGLKVPEDISIVGYDNIHLSSVLNPPITTIAHPVELMAQCIMDMLFNCIDPKDQPGEESAIKNHNITPELIIRRSTGSCNKSKKD